MAIIERQDLTQKDLQVFRGGADLPIRYANMVGAYNGVCCSGSRGPNYAWLQTADRLLSRMRFENATIHERPNGAKQVWSWVRSGFQNEMAAFIDDVKQGATLGVIAPPTYSWINSIGISVDAPSIPADLEFKLTDRNGLFEGKTAKVRKYVYTLEGCEVSVDEEITEGASLDDIVIKGDATPGVINIDYIIEFDATDKPFNNRVDEIRLEVTNYPQTQDFATPLDMGLRVACSYDVVIRAEQ